MIVRFMLAAFLLASTSAWAQVRTVWMETTYGPMQLELDQAAAPITVANFLSYVEDGFFDGLIFQRVIEDFIIQSGAYDERLAFREPTYPPIASETDNGLLNVPGSIAMALSGNPPNRASATSQFYINTGVNDFLDADFTVFGEVVGGLGVLDRIQSARTGTLTVFPIQFSDFPAVPARIVWVFEADGFPLVPLHTGSWFDPANPGRGLNVEVANPGQADADATLVIYLYDFFGGEQFWLAGNVNFDFGPSEVTVPMFILDGPQFGDDFDPDDRNIEEWGTITFRVTGCSTAVMTYDSPEFGSGERPLTRLTRPNDLDSCDDF